MGQREQQGAAADTVGELQHQPAGAFSGWLRAARRAHELKVIDAEVPCGSCTACCRSFLFIHIKPDETRTLARVPKQLLFPAPGSPKGHVLMGYNHKGECPMFVENRCSIYDDRPRTCRDFDCRVFAAAGVGPDDDGPQALIAAQARRWEFERPTAADHEEFSAVRAAGAFLREHRASLPGGLADSPVPIALLAIRIYRLFLASNGGPVEGRPGPSDAEIARAVLAELEKIEPPVEDQPDRAPPPRRTQRRRRR
jgi:Fe-S-cluster containining protein